ncbi:MAG: winged helix-turn-helix transcriptional regulator [Clostridia bacterium]|nr:winged helix-turn-helix transcriptional regulator [Clostridia bacterium]
MKKILIRHDGSLGAQEYGRMLELELRDRGVSVTSEKEDGLAAALLLCNVFDETLAAEAAALTARFSVPVLCCAKEFAVPLPNGAIAAERPLDVMRLCDSLASAAKGEEIAIPPALPDTLPSEGIVLDRLLRKVTCQGEPVTLTAREYDLLAYLDDHRGIPVSREELAREVWSLPLSQSNVVDVYVRYLRKKLDEPFDTRFILTVRGKGYMLK